MARAGIGLVPEGRQVFPNLTVRENLLVAAGYGSDPHEAGGEPWTLERIYEMFPALEARKNLNGRNLSGGEQQMLAIGRALMTNARLILLDEATEGLAPLVCAEIWRCLERLKAVGQAILLIDSNHGALMQIADRHYIMEKGRITWTGDSAARGCIWRRRRTCGTGREAPIIRQRWKWRPSTSLRYAQDERLWDKSWQGSFRSS